jgi:hypothetical protein
MEHISNNPVRMKLVCQKSGYIHSDKELRSMVDTSTMKHHLKLQHAHQMICYDHMMEMLSENKQATPK